MTNAQLPNGSSQRAFTLSIIMPVHDGAAYLERSLGALCRGWLPGCELIVVDDASSDRSGELAGDLIRQMPDAQVVRLHEKSGAAAARNAGAQIALGDGLVFLDADVELHTGTLRRIAEAFANHPALAAVFGSYDADPADPHIISRFRNLLHHYIHQQGRGPASTFWTGCGAVRRDVFNTVGPFRDASITCMEDIDYGHRLRDAGHRVELDPNIQCRHLKRWTLVSMIYTDIFRRAAPWTVMMLSRRRDDAALNVVPRERKSAAAALATVLFLVAATACAVYGIGLIAGTLLIASALAAGALVTLQSDFYSFLRKQGNPIFAAACLPLHILYYLCALTGLVIGSLVYLMRKSR